MLALARYALRYDRFVAASVTLVALVGVFWLHAMDRTFFLFTGNTLNRLTRVTGPTNVFDPPSGGPLVVLALANRAALQNTFGVGREVSA